jgi:hypothetical protein
MAVFKSVEQALFVAFLFEVLPATSRSPTAIVIDSLRENYDAWGVEPRSQDRAIDFQGLSPLEVRAQCASVIGMVMNHLPGHERDAVLVRYSRRTDSIEGAMNKPGAVNRQAAYTAPQAQITKPLLALAVAWSCWGTKTQRRDLTVRAIAEEFCESDSTVNRQRRRMREAGEWLFARAVDRLEPLMKTTELVETPYFLQSA